MINGAQSELDILRGRDGRDGRDGLPGLISSAAVPEGMRVHFCSCFVYIFSCDYIHV